jgi:hypothetical protein
MALSRCRKCGAIAEHEPALTGSAVNCVRCASTTQVHDTVQFVSYLLDQFFTQKQALDALRAQTPELAPRPASVDPAAPDIHNTDRFSSDTQHQVIVDWFRRKQIGTTINSNAVNTSGFFDEAAVAIGSDYELLGPLCERIRYAQSKEYNSAVIYLDKKSPEDARTLEDFCRQLHQYSLVARCIPNREEKTLRLVLQNAPGVRRFFSGEWLEWYALMVGLRVCQERQTAYSCARNLRLTLANDEARELDVFFLLRGERPLYIECKTGEFRQDLDKYVALRKRLAIESKYFVVCVSDLDADQAKGLSAMYDLSFQNTQTLGAHLASLI